MATPLLEFDPTSEDASNSPLEVWNTASYAVTDWDPGNPPTEVQWAGSVDTEGQLPSSRKDGNRTIALTVEVLTASALRTLQAKIAKVRRDGGTLKQTLPASGETIIFDLLTADTFAPQFDVKFFINSGAYCTVQIALTALPIGRGTEIDLGDNVETTLPVLVFTDTALKGDMPALGRLVIDEDQGQDQGVVFFGVQSRYYDSASTAALYFPSESMAGTVLTGPSGATGGGTNNTVGTTALTTGLLQMGYVNNATHVGTFRLLARVQFVGTGTLSTRMRYVVRDGVSVFGDTITASSSYASNWLLIDYGQMIISPSTIGTHKVLIEVQAASTVAGDDFYLDWIALIPVTEGSGQVALGTPTGQMRPLFASGHLQIDHKSVQQSVAAGVYWSPPDVFEGSYLRLPPAGLENRTLRIIVKASRGQAPSIGLTPPGVYWYDSGTDDISAHLYYTPRYLTVPTP